MWDSFLCVFEMLTGANWFTLMWNAMKGAGPLVSAYFIFWMLLGNFILLNLFLAILIENFAAETSEEKAAREEAEMLRKMGIEKKSLGEEPGATSIVDR